MSDSQPTYVSKMYCKHSHPYAYATLTDFNKGQGLIQIHSDWGTYSHFWGSMGSDTIAEFLMGVSPSYLEGKLTFNMNQMGVKRASFGRLTKFMAQCWPELRDIIKKEIESDHQSRVRSQSSTDEATHVPLAGVSDSSATSSVGLQKPLVQTPEASPG